MRRYWVIVLAVMCAAEVAVGGNITMRGDLKDSHRVFTETKRGTVAFLGGSITEMEGYRPRVCTLLEKRFPETVFTFVNAGIASTCSTTGAFRFERDVWAEGKVDLLFVEFAVNDDQDAHHPREVCIRGMEGIVRHARRLNPAMDIVMLFFVNEAILAAEQKGETPLTIAAHTAVAEQYRVPTVNVAAELAARVAAGTMTWKQYGGVHPAAAGSDLCAGMVAELFRRMWDAPPPVAITLAVPEVVLEPLDARCYERGRFIGPEQAVVKRGWTVGVPDWARLAGAKRERFMKVPMLCAEAPGAEAELAFEGTAVGVYVVAGPDAGVLEYRIDGGAWREADLLHAYSKGLHYPRTVMLADDLAPGRHVVALRVSSKTSGAGHAVRIMQFVMNHTLTPTGS